MPGGTLGGDPRKAAVTSKASKIIKTQGSGVTSAVAPTNINLNQ